MEEFLFLTHDNSDPYFNIASEEYLLKQKEGYYIYLWKNSPSVIVGVNQNTLEEVNLEYLEANGIKLVRRMTGGGAVYHDLNNICYTVIAPFDDSLDNYKKFTAPVIEYLNSLGVKAEFSGRNDITVNGKKISGNAQTVYKNRIMHHGTLLFNTDMSALENVLKPNKLKIESKGIKSVRARVTNIFTELNGKMHIDEFFEGLKNHFRKTAKSYIFTKEDIDCINKLIDNKYSCYNWNVGYSPKGKNRFDAKFSFGIISISFDTQNGKVKNPAIKGDFFTKKDISELAKKLDGIIISVDSFMNALSDIGEYIDGATNKQIVDMIFS